MQDMTLIRSVDARASGCAGLAADPRGRWVAACFGDSDVRFVAARSRRGRVGSALDAVRQRVGSLAAMRAAGTGEELIRTTCETDKHGNTVFCNCQYEEVIGNAIDRRYSISFWDAHTGGVRTRADIPGEPLAVMMSADGQQAVTISERNLAVVDTAIGETITQPADAGSRITACARDAELSLVAVGVESGQVRLYRPRQAQRQAGSVNPRPADLRGCYAPPRRNWILAWSAREAATYDKETGTLRHRFGARATGVFINGSWETCCVAPDGSWLATVDDDGTVRIWDPETGIQMATASGEDAEEFLFAKASSGTWMATWTRDGRIRIRNPAGLIEREMRGHRMTWPPRACAQGDSWLATQEETATHLWDPLSGRHLTVLEDEIGAAPLPRTSRWPQGLLATIDLNGRIAITVPLSGERPYVITDESSLTSRDAHTRVSCADPAGNWVITSDDQGGLRAWLLDGAKAHSLLSGTGEPITSCSVCADGAAVAATESSGIVRIWDTRTWRQTAALRVSSSLNDASWCDSANRLFVAGGAGVYCLRTGGPGAGIRHVP
jgi:WD40 repeat protein